MKKFRSLLILLLLAAPPSNLKGQEDIAVCHLDLLSKNDKEKIVGNVILKMPSLLSSVGWWNSLRLISNVMTYKQWAEEIEGETNEAGNITKQTYGTGNIIKKLLEKIRTETDIDLPDIVNQLMSLATLPIVDNDALPAIQRAKQPHRFLIGISNQDPLEHEIYSQKMRTDHNINLSQLFDQIVTIARYDDPHVDLRQDGVGFYPVKEKWYVVAKPYPSEQFNAAIMAAARSLAPDITTMPPIVSTIEQLNALTYHEK